MAKKIKPLDTLKLSAKEKRCMNYMIANGSIDSDRARKDLGDARLSQTILQLRDKGVDINTLRIDVTNRYGEPTWYGKYVFANPGDWRE